jgi:hypothetical protein
LLVIASNTLGQNEVAAYFPQSVKIVNLENAREIVDAIKFFSDKDKVNHQTEFEKIFSWEAQEEKLNNIIEQYL